jgi:hypothetical protein
MSTPNITFSVKTDQWFTPPEVMSRVHFVFQGWPDLDPCGSPESNKIVQAKNLITTDSLVRPWPKCDSVFCNPPSGKYKGSLPEFRGMSNPSAFFLKLNLLFESSHISQYIYLGYSIEQLQTLQTHNDIPWDSVICIPKKRIRFVDQSGDRSSPTHANFILYRGADKHRFDMGFGDYGIILNC